MHTSSDLPYQNAKWRCTTSSSKCYAIQHNDASLYTSISCSEQKILATEYWVMIFIEVCLHIEFLDCKCVYSRAGGDESDEALPELCKSNGTQGAGLPETHT